MTPLEAAHVAGSLVTVLITVAVGYWVDRNHDDSAARAFVALVAICGAWAAVVGVRILFPDLAPVALFHLDAALAWMAPVFWFVFALHYTGREHLLTRRATAVLGAAFALSFVVSVTNPYHRLVWSGYRFVEDPFPYLYAEPTTHYLLHLVVLYVLLLSGLGVLVELLVTASRRARTQLVLVAVGATVPIGLNVATNLGTSPFPEFDYTVFGTSIFATMVGIALFRYRLFDVAPLARNAVLGATREAIVVVDARGRVVDYNDAAVGVFPGLIDAYGESVQAATPGLVDDRAVERDDPSGDHIRPPTGFDPGAIPDEVVVHHGGERHIYGVGVSMVERGGIARGYVVVLRDLSNVERYARRLEQQTKQLDRFATTVSHDLRNPLGVARGMAEQLHHGDADPEHVDELETALDRMDTLIDDALTLAREGEALEDPESVSLSWIGQRAWETSDTGTATLRLDVDDARVYADPDRLQRVFENLYRNAIEHGSTGGPTPAAGAPDHGPDDVTVRIGTHEDDFFVEDDGPGIPEGKRDQVFERGYTTADDGTGLGLPIVRSIAEAHGWEVSVEESREGGARFVFSGVEFVPSEDERASSSRACG